jgi:hypothetical protein
MTEMETFDTPIAPVIAPRRRSRRLKMIARAIARVAGNAEQTTLARFAYSFVGFVNERARNFGMRFMAAMDESRRREGERLIQRYRHLIDDPD